MIRIRILPLLAVAGLSFAVVTVLAGAKPTPVAQPVAQPSDPPFSSYIAGSALVEASTENVAIGTNLSGIVAEVFVKSGARVQAGDPLFRVDDRDLRAQLVVREAALAASRSKLERLRLMPRTEDIPPAEARVEEATGTLEDLKTQLAVAESVKDKRALSIEELNRRRFAVRVGEARLTQARTQLELLKAGTWKPDLDVAKAEVDSMQAQVTAAEIEISRLTVRSPLQGQVLQMNVRAGEFAQAGVLQRPLMVLGNVDRLHVRVDIDENEAWRFGESAAALAFMRGNRELRTELHFEYVEPYVVPKRSLTGDSTERVDTRVMQVLYSFAKGKLPVRVGQQMDVFIEAPGVASSGPAAATRPARAPAGAGK